MSFGSIIPAMVIDMNETRLNTVAHLRACLEGTLEVQFQPISNDVERYGFIAAVLKRIAYRRLVRADKGVRMRYLAHTTGYSRQQLTRLVGRCRPGGAARQTLSRPRGGLCAQVHCR